MTTVTTKKETVNISNENVYSLQRARRGDLWFFLSLIIPISIIPATVQMGSITTKYLIFNWVFFEINIINSTTISLIPFWLQKNPLYAIITIIQVVSIICALGIRFFQELNQRSGKIVESGSIGMFAVIIILMEIMHLFLANYEIVENFYDTNGLTWQAQGATVSNSLIPAIPLIPQHIIFAGYNIVLPIQYILILSLIPIGLFFTVFWAYQEHLAFPAAFERWVIRFFRITIILMFIVISVIPIIWIFFVSFNQVAILKQALTIWPIDFTKDKVTISAWMSFLHFKVHPPFDQTISFSFVWTYSFKPETYTVTLPVTGFLFTSITIVLMLLTVYIYKQRKKISAKYDNLTPSKILMVSSIIIIAEIIMTVCTIFGIGWYIYAEVLKTSSLNLQLINSFYFTILVLIITAVLILLQKFVNRQENVFGTYESSNKVYRTSILRMVNYTTYALLACSVLVLVSFVSLLYNSIIILQSDFISYVWFFVGVIVACGMILSFIIPKYYQHWVNALESYFLEYGVAFNLAIIVGYLAVIFGLLSDVSYDWIYHQGPTNVDYPIGEWFFLTIGLCTIVGGIAIILASLSSYALSRFRFHGRALLGTMILSTQIFPGAILALTLYIMMAKIGLTGNLVGLGFAYSVIALPFVTYLLKGFFDAIPVDLEEQAMIDGCTRTQAFWRISFPLVLPGIVSTFIFAFLAMYTEYLMAMLIYVGNRSDYLISLAMLNVFTADQTQRGVYYNDLAVYAILVALPIIAGFVYLQRYLLKGLVAGSTKG